ncbi:MAG: hypothetical protein RBQ97_10070 [Acholeplasma sp.]|nr:hypothetical protein [Acholeplasma sp.]
MLFGRKEGIEVLTDLINSEKQENVFISDSFNLVPLVFKSLEDIYEYSLRLLIHL